MTDTSRAVLVTGCSSGIGQAIAHRLVRAGWPVYATARRAADLTDLADAGCRTLPLDVTDEASMVAAVGAVEDEHGAVGVLVNNAGYSQSGALETVPIEAARRQFETNVFGLVRLTQLALPAMRAQGWGRVVNMSSMGGRLGFPGGGWYHATKYALEALSDALRFEVAPFGIDVVVIQPGFIMTKFAASAMTGLTGVVDAGGSYARFNQSVAKSTAGVYERGGLVRLGGVPEDVAAVVEKAITADRPRTRYPVTASATVLKAMRSVMTDRQWDRMMARSIPPPTQSDEPRPPAVPD